MWGLIIFRSYTQEIHPLDIYFELVAGGKLGNCVLVNGYMFYGVKLYVLNYSPKEYTIYELQ